MELNVIDETEVFGAKCESKDVRELTKLFCGKGKMQTMQYLNNVTRHMSKAISRPFRGRKLSCNKQQVKIVLHQ